MTSIRLIPLRLDHLRLPRRPVLVYALNGIRVHLSRIRRSLYRNPQVSGALVYVHNRAADKDFVVFRNLGHGGIVA